MAISPVVTGTYTGDGAAQNISIGFIPAHVVITNKTDGDASWFWNDQYADGTATLVADASTLASNGVTPYTGSTSASKGFTIGTGLSESAKVFVYTAFRGDGG